MDFLFRHLCSHLLYLVGKELGVLYIGLMQENSAVHSINVTITSVWCLAIYWRAGGDCREP